jgi:hypothetical protein
VILLIVIFLASATRHVRLFNADTRQGRTDRSRSSIPSPAE